MGKYHGKLKNRKTQNSEQLDFDFNRFVKYEKNPTMTRPYVLVTF